MIEAEPAASEPSPGGRSSRRRWARRLAGIALSILVLLVTLSVAARLYLSDDRIRRMARDWLVSRTGAPVELGALEVSLLRGIEARGLRFGPLPGFTRPMLVFDRVALRWRAWELLRLRVVVDELALDGVLVTLERTAEGRNLELVLERLVGPPVARPPAPAATTAPRRPPSLADLSLPVRVEVRRLEVVDLAADVLEPGLEAHVDHVNAEGRLEGHGRDLDVDLWLGLGERAADGESSHLRFVRASPAADLDSTTRLGIHVTAGGLARIEVAVDLDSRSHVGRPYALPPIDAAGRLELALDLVSGRAALGPCAWRVGRGTSIDVVGRAERILSDSPALELAHLGGAVDLDEIGPMVAAALPGTTVRGRVTFEVSPLATDLAALSRRALPKATVAARLEHVGYVNARSRVERLDGEGRVDAEGDVAAFAAKIRMESAESAGQLARRVGVTVSGTTPVSPFAGGEPAGDLVAHVLVDAAEAGAPAGRVRGLDLALDAAVPTALLVARPSAAPLRAAVKLRARSAESPAGGAEGIALALDARSWDLAGRRVEADLRLGTTAVWAVQKGDVMRLPGAGVTLSVGRAGDDYDLRHVLVALGDLVKLDARGRIAAATSPRPAFDGLRVTLSLPRLGELLAVLPPSQRPPMRVSGAAEMGLDVDGTVPLPQIQALASPPRVSTVADADAWRGAVRAYADFISAWAAWFDRGLPFVAACRLRLAGVDYADAANEAHGIEAAITAEMGRHGPRWRVAGDVARVVAPTPVEKAHFEAAFEADGAAMALSMSGSAASVAQAPLARPLTDARFALASRYRIGGDLLVETLRFDEAGHGVRLDASGLVSRPFNIALERGWERPGMPGLEATVRFDLGYGASEELVPLTEPGPSLAGSIGVDGSMRIADGVIDVSGSLSSKDFSYVAGPTAVRGMTGTLPFALELVAGRRDDAVVLARTGALGGGVLSLVTSGDDIRDRPARPVYYDRLRPYRSQHGLAIARIRQDRYDVADFRLDGRVEGGMLVADWLSMSILGGDIVGNLAVQLGRDGSLRGDMLFQVSGIDASYFEALKLQPGPDSQLNADFRLGFLFAARKRDLSMNANVTKCGAETFDRFLQTLDPQRLDEKIQNTRDNLRWVRIDQIAVWVRYETLNMDLAYDTRIGIPFTSIGYRPIDREMLRRQSISEYLDSYVQPYVDTYVAGLLGWTHEK